MPRYVLYAVILTALMWIIWNKTTFGKNMFAVGSNEEAANVSGVNVTATIILVFVLAGIMYSITGFFDGARIASVNANTGTTSATPLRPASSAASPSSVVSVRSPAL